VYTRRGCHLCDDALDLLDRQRRRFAFDLTVVDVDTNPEWAAQYGECVPVTVINGKLRFRGGINPVLLARLLRAESRSGRKANEAR
jgi:glutaredoxin